MGLSLGHLIILAVIILLFGTRRLPELASALGKSARAFRDALNGSGSAGDSGTALKSSDRDPGYDETEGR